MSRALKVALSITAALVLAIAFGLWFAAIWTSSATVSENLTITGFVLLFWAACTGGVVALIWSEL